MDPETIIVGGARFLAWIVLLTISLCYYNIGRLLTAPEFKIPSYGVSIEAASWAIHQMGWWYWHLKRISGVQNEELDVITHLADRIAAVAYLGTAIGGTMILYPFLVRTYPTSWAYVGGIGMVTVFGAGVLIALMWV